MNLLVTAALKLAFPVASAAGSCLSDLRIRLRFFPSPSAMFGFLKQVGDYTGMQSMQPGIARAMVTFDRIRRRPVTVQYPTRSSFPPSVIGAGSL